MSLLLTTCKPVRGRLNSKEKARLQKDLQTRRAARTSLGDRKSQKLVPRSSSRAPSVGAGETSAVEQGNSDYYMTTSWLNNPSASILCDAILAAPSGGLSRQELQPIVERLQEARQLTFGDNNRTDDINVVLRCLDEPEQQPDEWVTVSKADFLAAPAVRNDASSDHEEDYVVL
jgi:hypothetical protein